MEKVGSSEGYYLPLIPQQVLTKARETLANLPQTKENQGLPYSMANRERNMLDSLHKIGMQTTDPEMFFLASQAFYSILIILERDGYRFPEPDTETLGVFLDQWRNFRREVKPILVSVAPDSEKLARISELKHLFPIPDPEDYYEENPHLMNIIELYPEVGIWGAMSVYELKRRQAIKEATKLV